MLIEKAKELIELSQSQVKLNKEAQTIEGFKTREKQLLESHKRIKELVEALRLFRKQNLINSDFQPTIKELLLIIETNLNKYQKKPESILNKKNFDGTIFKEEINKVIIRVEKDLLQAWKTYLKINKPSIQTELLKILERLESESFRLNIEKIRNLQNQIKSEQFPRNKQEFDNIKGIIDELNNAWTSLNADNIPQEVWTFLQAATSNTGANLEQFSPKVRPWIIEYHLDKKLRIRFN